jgi:hypothetical protein
VEGTPGKPSTRRKRSLAHGIARHRRRDLLAAIALLAFGILLVLQYTGPDVRWAPDSLFYMAQMREVQGESRADALREVFASDGAAELKRKERDLPPALRRIDNPAWQTYSSRFYRRRWTVPVLAAALQPVAGQRSIEDPSLVGWALLAPLLYLLLRRRFAPGVSVVVSVFCTVLPPVFHVGPVPSTDLLALSLLIAALLAAWQVRVAGLGWLPAWMVLVLVLSFTRDANIVLIAATGWLALRERSRRSIALLATGVLASLPAPLLFAAPFRDNLAYTFNAYRVPTDTSWSSILSEYPHRIATVLRYDLEYPLENAVPPLAFVMGALVLIGLVKLYVLSDRDDPFLILARGAGLGSLVTILIAANYSNGRLELVLIPAIAAGLGMLAERAWPGRRARPSRATVASGVVRPGGHPRPARRGGS